MLREETKLIIIYLYSHDINDKRNKDDYLSEIHHAVTGPINLFEFCQYTNPNWSMTSGLGHCKYTNGVSYPDWVNAHIRTGLHISGPGYCTFSEWVVAPIRTGSTHMRTASLYSDEANSHIPTEPILRTESMQIFEIVGRSLATDAVDVQI